jgi:hypothetical protein
MATKKEVEEEEAFCRLMMFLLITDGFGLEA